MNLINNIKQWPGIRNAINRAREDERKKCDIDKEKALKEQAIKLNNKWSLIVKELEATIESMEFRIKNHEQEKTKVEKEKQIVRETSIFQRRIVSDIIHIARQKRDDDLGFLQKCESLQTSIDNIEMKLIGIEKK